MLCRLEQRAAVLPAISSFRRNKDRAARERERDSELDLSNVSSLRGFGRYNQLYIILKTYHFICFYIQKFFVLRIVLL